MFSKDISYYERRLTQERFQTLIAERGDVATVHRKLALLYEGRLEDLKTCQLSYEAAPQPLSPTERSVWSERWNRQPARSSADIPAQLSPADKATN